MAERLTENQWQQSVTRAAGLAMGDWLIANRRLKWRVEQLTGSDLSALADNAIATYIKLRTERQEAPDPWSDADAASADSK